MATIKIKELPIKTLSGISTEDIMVIEDKIDTKQITVQDLQLFFSSDNKINALKTAIETRLDEIVKDYNKQIQTLERDDTEINNRIEDLYNDHENTKKRLGNLIEKVVDIENLLNATIECVEANETDISNLQTFTKQIRSDLDTAIKNIETHTSQITKIEEKNKEQDDRFDENEKELEEFKNEYQNKMNELDKTISENKSEAKDYSDQLYDQIMQYIDFYHHYHEDPPNFDDPNWADTKQMNLIYKVGTVYETTIKDFNTEENLPGTWKYVGCTNVYNKDGDVVLTKYMYTRVE